MGFGTPVAQAFPFADGASPGHTCTFTAGAPSVGDFDLICVNSNATVTTPSGFTAAPTRIVSQGAYIYSRQAAGGESASVTLVTSVSTNTDAIWVRVPGALAADIANAGGVDATFTNVTPAYTSPALGTSGELALAFVAVHNFTGAAPTTPVWSSGYTPLLDSSQGTGSTGVWGAVAYKTPAGPGAESPSLSWTNNARNRYVLFLSLTPSGGATVTAAASPGAAFAATAAATLLIPAAVAASAAFNATGHAGDKLAHRPFTGTVTRPDTGTVGRP